ncbi:MAG: hypothetical protein P9X24_16890 [Candidatus Hatepunaea meridiana]|nr:hypothetical protein [Candidatus Hatepunaea meridiana]
MNPSQTDMEIENGFGNITEPHLLIVEGKDEENFFNALLKESNISGIQILSIGGKEKIHKNLSMLSVSPGFPDIVSIGIVRDADTDPQSAFRSVCTAIENAGLSKPAKPMQPVGQNPSVTVMILPDENSTGMLENVCLKSVENNPEYSCIEDFFNCLTEKGVTIPDDKPKAEVLAYLASNPEKAAKFRIGLLGIAAQKGYWPWENRVFNPLKNFLKLLVK